MTLLTPDQRAQLFKNGNDPYNDHKPVVRLFMTNTVSSWLLSEMYADQPGLAFGLCDLGLGTPELGYCYIPEMQQHEMPYDGILLQCDPDFVGKYSMSAYAAAARAYQRIITDDAIVKRFRPSLSL